MLINTYKNYGSQLCRLAAVEKGVKWKNYEVQGEYNNYYEPWYMKLNNMYEFPTLLYGADQTPITNEFKIMMAIDEKWEGKRRLNQECIDNPLFMERFNIVYNEIANEKGYRSFELMAKLFRLWISRYYLQLLFLSGWNLARKKIKNKDDLNRKLI